MLDAISVFKLPTYRIELCLFPGVCNVFRWFVPYSTRLAASLNTKIRKNQPSSFQTPVKEEFQSIQLQKETHISPHVFAHVNSMVILHLTQTAATYKLVAFICKNNLNKHSSQYVYGKGWIRIGIDEMTQQIEEVLLLCGQFFSRANTWKIPDSQLKWTKTS